MFRKMRRSRQQLPETEAVEILKNGTSGVLAVSGDEGYPYAVPLSYAYSDGKIIFHCAKTGHKIDAVSANNKASFCVIDQDKVVPGEYTTYFRSVIAFGRIRIVEDDDEKRRLAYVLAGKYRPGFEEERQKAIDKEFNALCIMEMTIEHLTGKEAIELVREKGR